MRFGQTFRNLRRDFNRLSHRQQAGVKQLAQRFPLYHFHRNVVSGTVLSKFVDGNDIRMVEGRRRACFLLATLRSRRASLARYTSPIPPAPSSSIISYGPSFVPEVRAIPHAIIFPRKGLAGSDYSGGLRPSG